MNVLIATHAIVTRYVINVKHDYLRQYECRAPLGPVAGSEGGAGGGLLGLTVLGFFAVVLVVQFVIKYWKPLLFGGWPPLPGLRRWRGASRRSRLRRGAAGAGMPGMLCVVRGTVAWPAPARRCG